MNDDELIQRLTRSLHEQADKLQPTPGQVPTPDDPVRAIWGPGAAGATTMAADAGGEESPRPAEYELSPPTGAIPIIGTRRRGWIAGGAAFLAVAAAVAVALLLPGRSHPISVPPAGDTTVPAPPSSVGPVPTSAVTTPAVTGQPVPSNFVPESVTFVSADDGWVIGSCPGITDVTPCSTLARTTDGGRTWTSLNAPPAANVRFANADEGWAWSSGGSAASTLYRTSDGGKVWTGEANPFPGATIGDLEISGGSVQLVAYGTCTAGSPGCQGQTVEELFSRSLNGGLWTQSPYRPPIGAGPVPSPAIVLWGSSGWLINVNRVTVSGARLVNGSWAAWTPPCAGADGAATLAASSALDLSAVCDEGVWGTPDAGTQADTPYLWTSTDGGSTFHDVGAIPVRAGGNPVTMPPGHPSVVIVAYNGDGLTRTVDGGATWSSIVSGGIGGVDILGFTTAEQGVALVESRVPALWMTYDGGRSWTKVRF